MTWGNNSVFQILIIQGSQAVTGLFLYNGLGAPGNPPQFAAVASTVTTDPFGNAITSSKILIQGNVITESGGIFRTAAAAPLIQLDGPHNAELFYDAGIHLADSIAPVATTDGLGNTVQSDFTAYGSANNTYAQLSGGVVRLFSGVFQALAANFNVSGGAGVNAQLNVTSGTGTEAGASGSTLQLGDSGTSGRALQILDGKDGQTYNTERVRQSTTSTQQFTLASAVAVTGLSRHLGVGTYHVRLKVFWVPSGVVGSSHVHNFAFSGTVTGNVNGQCWQAQAASAVQQSSLNAGAGNNLTAGLTSPAHVAFPGWTELDADITVTVAGTLTHTITLTTAGDDITTSAGTYWEITPEA